MSARNAGLNVLTAGIFVAALCAAYVVFISQHFAYAGYELYSRSTIALIASALLCLLPLVFYRGARTISSVVSAFVYGLLYLPTIITLAIGTRLPDRESLLIQLVFGACMSMLFATDLLVVRPPLPLRFPGSMAKISLIVTSLCTAYVLFVYRGNLAFVSFEDVYVHRSSNVMIGSDVLTRYLTSWLTNVFAPICLAYAFVTKSVRYLAVGLMGFFVMYLATAAKFALLLPAAYVGIYWAVSGRRNRFFLPIMMLGLAFTAVVLSAAQESGSPLFAIASLLLVRTIINGGIVTAKYHEFFEVHQQTSMTHVNMIGGLFGKYPYGDLQVGQVVGPQFWGPDMNANAHFWATDGIAAFGITGLPIATAICVVVLMVLNSATRGWNHAFVVLCFVPFILSLLNTSVFQSVWSGGALFLVLLFTLTSPPPPLADLRYGDAAQAAA